MRDISEKINILNDSISVTQGIRTSVPKKREEGGWSGVAHVSYQMEPFEWGEKNRNSKLQYLMISNF